MHKNQKSPIILISMIIPLTIASAAIMATLFYASVLDIRDRRVPFSTWYPMLLISIPMALFFYGFSILGAGAEQFIRFVLQVFGLAFLLVVVDYIYTRLRYGEKTPLEEILDTAFIWVVLSIPIGSLLYGWQLGSFPPMIMFVVLVCILCAAFYALMVLNIFGGADVWALIFISVSVPVFPFAPLLGYPPLLLFPFTVLVNALILNLLAPAAICVFNIRNGHHAPFPYMLLGFPVEGDKIQDSYGFVMEEIVEIDGVLKRRFLKVGEAMGGMVHGTRIYTKDLRQHPDEYQAELGLFRRAGTVWISYGVPFIVPITAGMGTALVFGDILFAIMMVFLGG